MTPQVVHQQLVQLNEIMDNNPLQSSVYRDVFDQYDQLLFGHVTIRDISLIKDYLPQPIPDDTIALMIATVMVVGRSLTSFQSRLRSNVLC